MDPLDRHEIEVRTPSRDRPSSGRRSAFLLLIWAVLLVPLLRHQSTQPRIGPYSLHYALMLLVCGLLLVVALVAPALSPVTSGRIRRLSSTWLESRSGPRRRLVHGAALVALLAIHATALLLVLPRSLLRGEQPYSHVDYAHHFHQIVAVNRFLEKTGSLAGYDPFFAAGYPAGTITDIDMKASEAFAYVLHRLGISLVQAYRLDIVGKFLLEPFLLYGAAWCLGFAPGWRLAATALGIAVWHVDPMLRGFNIGGMYNFVFVCFLAPLVLALLERWFSTARPIHLVLFALLGALLPMEHALGPVIILLPALAALLVAVRRKQTKRVFLVVVAVAAIIAANLPWLRAAIPFLNQAAPADMFYQTNLPTFLMQTLSFGLPALLWILGTAGVIAGASPPLNRQTAGALLAWNGVLAVLGSGYPVLDQIECARFAVSLTTCSIIPAIALIQSTVEAPEWKTVSWLVRRGPTKFLLASVAFLFLKPALAPLERTADYWQATRQRLGEWLATRTQPDYRILFEDQSPSGIDPPSVRWYANREFIGGPFSRLNLQHRFAGAATKTGKLFDTPIADLDENDWRQAIRAYNIGYAFAFTSRLQTALDRYPDVFQRRDVFQYSDPPSTGVAQLGNAAILYDVSPALRARLIEGDATVTADFDELRVRGATPGRLVLPYHWMAGLRTSPDLAVEPVQYWRDPVPFISVLNGNTLDFDITWGDK